MKLVVWAFLAVCYWACVHASGSGGINVVMYNYIPDLNLDGYASLQQFLQAQFFLDTGYNITLKFNYNGSSYVVSQLQSLLEHNQIVEMDTVMFGVALQNEWIVPLNTTLVNTDGVLLQAIQMVTDEDGTLYGMPSYACTNILFSYDMALAELENVQDMLSWIDENRQPNQRGFTTDMLDRWALRGVYIDSFVDSFPGSLMQSAYSTNLSSCAVDDLRSLLDTCQSVSGDNPCANGTFQSLPVLWGEVVSGQSMLMLGFPEALSGILQTGGQIPYIRSAVVGQGDHPFLFSDAFFVSKLAPCDEMCQRVVYAWLGWAKLKHPLYTTLGLDMSPPKPRYLQMTHQPSYNDIRILAHPTYNDIYLPIIQRTVPLETLHILATHETQYQALVAAIIEGSVTFSVPPFSPFNVCDSSAVSLASTYCLLFTFVFSLYIL